MTKPDTFSIPDLVWLGIACYAATRWQEHEAATLARTKRERKEALRRANKFRNMETRISTMVAARKRPLKGGPRRD